MNRKQRLYEIMNRKRLDEALTTAEVTELQELIRMEFASIMFDLFKKRKAWQ